MHDNGVIGAMDHDPADDMFYYDVEGALNDEPAAAQCGVLN